MVAGPKDEAEILAAFIVAACNEKDEREADL